MRNTNFGDREVDKIPPPRAPSVRSPVYEQKFACPERPANLAIIFEAPQKFLLPNIPDFTYSSAGKRLHTKLEKYPSLPLPLLFQTGVDDDSDRAIVDKGDLHVSTKDAALYLPADEPRELLAVRLV